jgi:hypothetical protein
MNAPRVKPVSSLDLPHGCITANALRSLASTMDRLSAWHTSRGGHLTDMPCLKDISVQGETIIARVTVGNIVNYRLEYGAGSWEFR